MCGICGFITRKNCEYRYFTNQLEAMNDEMANRGPNDRGEEVYREAADLTVGLAHRRLAVLDLSSRGHQPMHSTLNDLVVVFNGEIYNYQELKKELAGDYCFVSNCDTEVILAGYKKWGENVFSHLDGMFAIAIYDREKKCIVLGRDRVGKKPLYYYCSGNDEYMDADSDFVFASELKPILKYDGFSKEIMTPLLERYLSKRYVYGKQTIFKDVYRVEPGNSISIDLVSGKINTKKYWNVFDTYFSLQNNYTGSFADAVMDLDKLLTQAVQKRMVADVPLGSFLSGGIDSTLITAIMQHCSSEPVNTYTIGFREKGFNEALYAKKIADYLGCNHHEQYIEQDAMIEFVRDLPYYCDEPIGDAAIIPNLLLSQMASKDSVVVLTGDGGDELFCGYRTYENAKKKVLLSHFSHLAPPLSMTYGKTDILSRWLFGLRGMKNTKSKIQVASGDMAWIINGMLNIDIRKNGFIPDIIFPVDLDMNGKDPIRQNMLLDFKTTLRDCYMIKTDRSTMAYSMEARCPLLDTSVMEYSFGLPTEYLYDGKEKKRILKSLLEKYVPKELWDRPKQGFIVPVREWMLGSLRDDLERVSCEKFIKEQGIFDHKFIRGLIGNMENENNYTVKRIMWSYLMFQLWYEKWMI